MARYAKRYRVSPRRVQRKRFGIERFSGKFDIRLPAPAINFDQK
jgi:hypothetical protein